MSKNNNDTKFVDLAYEVETETKLAIYAKVFVGSSERFVWIPKSVLNEDGLIPLWFVKKTNWYEDYKRVLELQAREGKKQPQPVQEAKISETPEDNVVISKDFVETFTKFLDNVLKSVNKIENTLEEIFRCLKDKKPE